ncbi:MAG: hypothetical protein QXG97_07445, partial [Nitrososphaerota archaeon]
DFITRLGGGRAKTESSFRPPRTVCPTDRREAEAKRTISRFSLAANFLLHFFPNEIGAFIFLFFYISIWFELLII